MNLDTIYTFCICQTNWFKLVCFSDSWTFLLGMFVCVWINIRTYIKKLNVAIYRVDGMIYV